MSIDFGLALRIINLEPDPKAALAAFVAQEREHAAHEAKAEAWDEGYDAGVDDASMSADFRAEFNRTANTNPYRD